MMRNGRPEDQQFDPEEHLYHRVVKEDLSGDRMLGTRIRYDNISINRQRYGPPEDVIFGAPERGIVRFIVKEVPGNVMSDTGGKPWSFQPIHVPDDDNYAHCEIWAFRDGQRVAKPNLPDTIKKTYRQKMSDHSLVIRQPAV